MCFIIYGMYAFHLTVTDRHDGTECESGGDDMVLDCKQAHACAVWLSLPGR